MQPSIWQAQENKQPVQLMLFENDNVEKIATDKLARIIYAETGARSLRSAEALAVMTMNLCAKSGRHLSEIVSDKTVFESLDQDSARHQDLFVNSARPDFQMCLRVARRAMAGLLADTVMMGTRFHRASEMPDWAISEGYVAEIDNLFFYL